MPDGLQTDGIEEVGQDTTTEAAGAETGEDQNDFGGDGYPDLPEALQAQLVTLARKFCEEDRYSRRLEVQECRRARFYWRGMQHLYWDFKSEGWQVLGPAGGSINTSAKLEESSVLYTTNIYQAFGLTIQAVLTQNMPSVRFEPQDPESAADIATAKAGERYKKIIEHNNDPIKLLTELAYFSWSDGRISAWTRWAENKRTGTFQETVCMYGALEVKVPITTDGMDDYVYLQYSNESHVAMVKADVNEKFRDKIKGGASGNGQDVYERTARISVKQGVSLLTQSGDTLSHLVTRQNTWMRAAAFEMLEKESDDKAQLEQIFPEGVRVRVDNGVYTGSWPEQMDDHWAVCHPMPGDGQYRNAIGTSMVSVQERFNDLVNITQDTYEYGIPAAWYDDELIDVDGIKRQRSRPGARYPVTRRPGEAMGENFFFEPAATVSADMLAFMKEMMGDLGQFLTGAFPALFGGNTGGNDTARGIATQRDQAMGRMGIVWRPIKKFWARIMEQAIRIGAKMRQEQGGDMSIAIPDEHGNMETTAVRIEELQGQIFCYPESDENFPESYTAKRANLMALLGSPMAASPIVQQLVAEPDNLQIIHDAIGIEELEIPGTDSRLKALTTINILLQSSPVPTPIPVPGMDGQPAVNPQTGQPLTAPGPPGPSLQPDPDTDDLMTEGKEYKRWINSPEGQAAKQENPPGFANVKLYFMAIKNLLQPPVPQVPVPVAAKAVAEAHAHGAAHGAMHGAVAGAQAAQGGGPPAAPPAPPQPPAA